MTTPPEYEAIIATLRDNLAAARGSYAIYRDQLRESEMRRHALARTLVDIADDLSTLRVMNMVSAEVADHLEPIIERARSQAKR